MKQHPWRTLEGLPRASWSLAVATLVNRAGTMVIPFLALYLTRGRGFSGEFAAAVFMIYGAGALVGGPIAGRLCDRLGAVRVLAGALVASGAVLLVMPLATSKAEVAAAVLAFAVTSESVRPSSMTVVGALVPPERKRSAFVLNRLAVNLGMSIGPTIGGLLAAVDFRYLFWIDGVTSILGAGLVLATVPNLTTPVKRAASGAFRDRRFLRFLLGVFLVGLVFFQVEAAVPLYAVDQLGVPLRAIGLLFAINTVMIIILEVPINGAIERWSHPLSLATGTVLIGVGFGGLVLARGVGGCAACFVVLTFGEMILFPAISSVVSDLSPEGRAGEYMGTYSMAFALAYSIGPGLGAWTLTRAGAHVLWPGVFVLALGAAAVLAAAAREPRNEGRLD
jgi:MFS family permease